MTDAPGRSRSIYWCEMAVIDGNPGRVTDDATDDITDETVAEGVTIDVVDGRISSIQLDSLRPSGSTLLRGLTVAGFANAHSHAFHRALRGRTQSGAGTFWTWRDVMYRAAQCLDPDGYFRLARATFSEMALAGVATVGEFHYVHHQTNGTTYRDPNAMGTALLAAATEAGIRITLLDTLYLHGGLADTGHFAPSGVQLRYADDSAEVWIERVESLVANVDARFQRVGAAIHSVRAVDPHSMAEVAEWAHVAQIPLHAHVSEQPAENEQCLAVHGMTPSAVFAHAGLVGKRFTAVHATHLNDADIALLGGSESFVCMCPTTERDLADGIGPTRELVAAGARLCLGSDSHAVIDMLEDARAVELNERLGSRRRGTHNALNLLRMATINGHASLGWHDAGAIRVGNRADLTTISFDSVRTAGATPASAIATAVFAANAADVTSVVVDGTAIVTDGRHRNGDVAADLHTSIRELFAE